MVIITKEFPTTVSTENDNRTVAEVDENDSENKKVRVWDLDFSIDRPPEGLQF